MLVLAALLVGAACAPRSGWTRTDARACAPKGPPVVCFEADPDQPLELHVADVVLLPGECAIGPRSRGGSLGLRVVDGRGPQWRRSVRLPGGRHTVVVIAEGRRRVVTQRSRCSSSP